MSYQPLPSENRSDVKWEDQSISVESSPRWRSTIEVVSRIFSTLVISTLCILLILDIQTRRGEIVHDSTTGEYTRKFESDIRFMSLDHRWDYLWAGDMRGGRRLVNLPPVKGHNMTGGITMFHQLHCLAGIHKALQRAHDGEDIGIDWRDDGHWPHCFHYLRQAILCAADETIELPTIKNGTSIKIIDGTQDLRTCGDSQRLYDISFEDS